MERVCNNIRMIKQRKTTFVKAVKSSNVFRQMFQIYSERRSQVILLNKINYAVISFGNKFKRLLKRNGHTKEVRNLKKI